MIYKPLQLPRGSEFNPMLFLVLDSSVSTQRTHHRVMHRWADCWYGYIAKLNNINARLESVYSSRKDIRGALLIPKGCFTSWQIRCYRVSNFVKKKLAAHSLCTAGFILVFSPIGWLLVLMFTYFCYFCYSYTILLLLLRHCTIISLRKLEELKESRGSGRCQFFFFCNIYGVLKRAWAISLHLPS